MTHLQKILDTINQMSDSEAEKSSSGDNMKRIEPWTKRALLSAVKTKWVELQCSCNLA